MIVVNGVTNTFSNCAKIEPPDIEKLAGNSLCEPEFGNVNDVWMSQATRGFCFTAKPRGKLIVSGELWTDHFDRHGTLGAEVHGAVDRAHASLSEELFDLVLVIE